MKKMIFALCIASFILASVVARASVYSSPDGKTSVLINWASDDGRIWLSLKKSGDTKDKSIAWSYHEVKFIAWSKDGSAFAFSNISDDTYSGYIYRIYVCKVMDSDRLIMVYRNHTDNMEDLPQILFHYPGNKALFTRERNDEMDFFQGETVHFIMGSSTKNSEQGEDEGCAGAYHVSEAALMVKNFSGEDVGGSSTERVKVCDKSPAEVAAEPIPQGALEQVTIDLGEGYSLVLNEKKIDSRWDVKYLCNGSIGGGCDKLQVEKEGGSMGEYWSKVSLLTPKGSYIDISSENHPFYLNIFGQKVGMARFIEDFAGKKTLALISAHPWSVYYGDTCDAKTCPRWLMVYNIDGERAQMVLAFFIGQHTLTTKLEDVFTMMVKKVISQHNNDLPIFRGFYKAAKAGDEKTANLYCEPFKLFPENTSTLKRCIGEPDSYWLINGMGIFHVPSCSDEYSEIRITHPDNKIMCAFQDVMLDINTNTDEEEWY